MTSAITTRFREAYAAHRAAEGRQYSEEQLLALPYLRTGPLAKQWRVRARTYDAFVRLVLQPMAAKCQRPLALLELGAGNAWLSYRVARAGHLAIAVDIRLDSVDGLAAAAPYVARVPARLRRVAASFEALPIHTPRFDVVVFNAALHYATDLSGALAEAARVARSGGAVVILDSPTYAVEVDGLEMIEEKRQRAREHFGERAGDLMALPFVEFITRDRLAHASTSVPLEWRRHRVWYPLWYEWRRIAAAVGRRRKPSRFDLWTAVAP